MGTKNRKLNFKRSCPAYAKAWLTQTEMAKALGLSIQEMHQWLLKKNYKNGVKPDDALIGQGLAKIKNVALNNRIIPCYFWRQDFFRKVQAEMKVSNVQLVKNYITEHNLAGVAGMEGAKSPAFNLMLKFTRQHPEILDFVRARLQNTYFLGQEAARISLLPEMEKIVLKGMPLSLKTSSRPRTL